MSIYANKIRGVTEGWSTHLVFTLAGDMLRGRNLVPTGTALLPFGIILRHKGIVLRPLGIIIRHEGIDLRTLGIIIRHKGITLLPLGIIVRHKGIAFRPR